MKTIELIYLIAFFSLVIFGMIYIFRKFDWKKSAQARRITTIFGLRSARVKFKSFNSSVGHSFLVNPKKEYEVVYRLETTEGKIQFNLNGQFVIETDSRIEGSEMITFGAFQPGISFTGENARNGEAYMKIYKRPKN